MKKQKSWIRRLIVWLMVVAALACLVIFVGIPLYGTQDEATIEKPVIAYYDGGKSKITMENDALTFEMDPTTTQFAVTEKASGRVWRSNPENAAKDPIAVSTNKAVLQSTMIVTYSSASGTIDYNNYTYSIENGSYTIDQKDDEVRVQYSVGKIERTYRIPTAITSERFNAFMDALSSKDAKKVKNVYTLYKPDKVATMDNRDELLALYPELENQELYVLRSDTSTANKAKMEGYFADAGYTEEDYELEVGSAGLGQPFKVVQQYNNFVGKEVEVLTADGKKVQGVLFAGYVRNFGTKDALVGDLYFSKNSFSNMNRMFRVTPEIVYNLGKVAIGLEYELTGVQYGTFGTGDRYGLATEDLHWICNNRLQLLLKYTF